MKKELFAQDAGKEVFISGEYDSLEGGIAMALNSLEETLNFLKRYPGWNVGVSKREISGRIVELKSFQKSLLFRKSQGIALDEEVVTQVIGAIMESEQAMIDIERLIFGDSNGTMH